MMSSLIVAFHPRSNRLLISWLQSLSAVILEPKKIACHFFRCVLIFWHEVMGPDAMILVFWMFSFKPMLPLSSITFKKKGSLVPLHFLPQGWCHLHIWGYWCFSQQSWFQPVLHPAWHFAWCTLHIMEKEMATHFSILAWRIPWTIHSMESDTTELLSLTYGRKQRGTKEPLDESERGELKSWLKTQQSKS